MMKKVWSVLPAVVLVFGLVAIGCGSSSSGDKEEEKEDLVEKTVFDMATDEGIQALPLGAIANTEFAGNGNPIKPLVRAGNDGHITYEVVDNAGVKALKFTTVADWGAGIDLRYATFGFYAGDKIKITGEFVSGTGRVQVNGKVGAENATIGGVDTKKTENGPFTMEFTLTADDVKALKGGDPAGLRIEGRKDGIVAQINNITINGLRPSNLQALPAPVIEATATGVKWEAIEGAGGYKVLANAGETPITTAGPSDTSVNLADLKSLADGTYSITVIALGIAGASKDSPASNAVDYTKVTPPPPSIKVSVAGTEQNAEIGKTKGTYVILGDTTGYTFTYPTEGSNINYGNSYAFFKVNLGTDNLSDFTKITVNIKGEAGDFNYKNNAIAVASKTEFTGYLDDSSGQAITAKVNTSDTSTAKDLDFPIDSVKATTAVGTDKVIYIAIIIPCDDKKDGATTSYTIKSIRLVK